MFSALLVFAVLAPLADSTPSARTLARLVSEHERRLDQSTRGVIGGGAPRLPDLTAGRVLRDAERARGIVRALDLLVPKELTPEEWITSRILRFDLVQDIETARYHHISFAFITPYQSPLSALGATLGAFQFSSPGEAARFLAMVDSIPVLLDTVRAALEERRARKVLLPKDEIRLIVPMLRGFATPGAANPLAVSDARLAQLSETSRQEFVASLGDHINRRVVPAFSRLADWMEGPYLAEAPDAVGLAQYPDGPAYYRSLVRRYTTLDVTPEQVHAIGLAEVARIDSAMTRVRQELGFAGSKAEFHAQLAKDPKFFARTPEEFGEKLMYHDARIRLRVGDLFSTMPRAQGNVQRLDPRLEGSMTFGYYQMPTARDSMGHYFYNGSALHERSMLSAASLVFHELVPGHHFQITLARESKSLPRFRREAMATAFIEGWGEYAASVAGELGLYSDPWDLYGRLASDMFLACRLVLDTGMNAMGWTRARAIAYMKEHTLNSDLQIDTETLRYSADLPGQALAYKMGSRELLRMREDARKRLGSRFDIKRWHTFVLEGGAMPFTVMRQRLEQWIAAGG